MVASVGHLWRTTGDISDSYASMLGDRQAERAAGRLRGPGHWNDPDMLEVGNGGMTDAEYRSHFWLWAEMAAPLLVGSDLRNPSPADARDPREQGRDRGRPGPAAASRAGSSPTRAGCGCSPSRWRTATWRWRCSTRTARPSRSPPPRPPPGCREGTATRCTTCGRRRRRGRPGTIAANVPGHGTVMYRVVADPNWRELPAGQEVSATVKAPSPAPTATMSCRQAVHDHRRGVQLRRRGRRRRDAQLDGPHGL